MTPENLNLLIGQIYDCALDPSGWTETLEKVRDHLDCAYVGITIFDFARDELKRKLTVYHSPWDVEWFSELERTFTMIPHIDKMRDAPLDAPVTQLQLLDEADFRKTEFYRRWVAPQNLRDTMNTTLIRRDATVAWMVAPTFADRALFTEADLRLAATLAPHVRRAILIGGLLDESRAQVRLQSRLLDQINVAIFLVDGKGRLVQMNAAGDALLSRGDAVVSSAGYLRAASASHRGPFAEAIARACTGDDADIGLWGNGLPLGSNLDAPSVAYILPMGRSEQRGDFGPGHAAVFVSQSGALLPTVELLTALSGMSAAEARVALAVAAGRTPQDIAESLGVSVHTVRKHLANIFDKTGYRSQSALAAFVVGLGLPLGAENRG